MMEKTRDIHTMYYSVYMYNTLLPCHNSSFNTQQFVGVNEVIIIDKKNHVAVLKCFVCGQEDGCTITDSAKRPTVSNFLKLPSLISMIIHVLCTTQKEKDR